MHNAELSGTQPRATDCHKITKHHEWLRVRLSDWLCGADCQQLYVG